MRLICAAPAALLLILGFSLSPAAQSTASQIKAINSYCKQIDAIQERRKSPELVYANIADVNSSKDKWRKFASEKALEKFREKSEAYDIAYNWRSGGKLIASNFTHSSPSGDWVNYVNHCFRKDGTVARVETDYRTFNGDWKIISTRYFNSAGRQISSSIKYLDLQSGKPKDASDGVMGDAESRAAYYRSVRKLPFATLLPK
jgi:hypothetical protein